MRSSGGGGNIFDVEDETPTFLYSAATLENNYEDTKPTQTLELQRTIIEEVEATCPPRHSDDINVCLDFNNDARTQGTSVINEAEEFAIKATSLASPFNHNSNCSVLSKLSGSESVAATIGNFECVILTKKLNIIELLITILLIFCFVLQIISRSGHQSVNQGRPELIRVTGHVMQCQLCDHY